MASIQCPRCEKQLKGANIEALQNRLQRHRCTNRSGQPRPHSIMSTNHIMVPRGPLGIFGDRMVTPERYAREQAAEKKARERRAKRRKTKVKKTAKRAITGKKQPKKKRWIIPGILYY